MDERGIPYETGHEPVTCVVGCGPFLGTKISVRVAGGSGAEEDVIRRTALIEVDSVRPGVGYRGLEVVGEALIELHSQAIVIAEAGVIELRDLPVSRIDTSAISGSGVRPHGCTRCILNGVSDRSAQRPDIEVTDAIQADT